MMGKQMSRRLCRLQLKKECISRTLCNAFVMFVMKLFSLQIGLNFLKDIFQKSCFTLLSVMRSSMTLILVILGHCAMYDGC